MRQLVLVTAAWVRPNLGAHVCLSIAFISLISCSNSQQKKSFNCQLQCIYLKLESHLELSSPQLSFYQSTDAAYRPFRGHAGCLALAKVIAHHALRSAIREIETTLASIKIGCNEHVQQWQTSPRTYGNAAKVEPPRPPHPRTLAREAEIVD